MVWLLSALALAGTLEGRPHPNTRWRTLETERFAVHYPVPRVPAREHALSGERAARLVADEAEALWLPLSDVTGYFPRERVHLVVLEDTDDQVGFALPQWDVVVVTPHPGPQLHRMRGRGSWVRSVLAHELAHVWTHKAAGALSEPMSYGLELGGVAEGSDGAVGARIVLGPAEPAWWSEGGAEYVAERVGVGRWDTARDTTLRTTVLEERLLSWDELQTAHDDVDQAESERIYQQGYAFVRWLDERFGPGTVDALGRLAARRYRARWDGLLEELTGIDAEALYAEHVAELRAHYGAQRDRRIEAGHTVGVEVLDWPVPWQAADLAIRDRWEARPRRDREADRERTGTWNLYPQLSPDGRWLAEHRGGWIRVSAVGEGALSALFGDRAPSSRDDLVRIRGERTIWLPAGFAHDYAFVPGQDAIVVVAPEHVDDGPLRSEGDGLDLNQLFVVSLEADAARRRHRGGREEVERLPFVAAGGELRRRYTPIPGTLRASDPAVSPDGERMAFVRYGDGSANLVVGRLDGSEQQALTDFDDGTWVSGPSWSPDGRRLVVAIERNDQQNLWIVDVDDGALRPLMLDRHEELDPHWGADGIYFVADPDGFYDVYRIDPDVGPAVQLTRVIGAAASPSITPDGHLLYASATAHGWKTVALPRGEWIAAPAAFATPDPEEAARDLAWTVDRSRWDERERRYRPLRSLATPAIAPILRLDATPDGLRPLAGAYARVRDVREVHDLVLHGLVGDDLLASGRYTWRGLRPELSLYGSHEIDRRTVALGGGARDEERRRVDRAGLTVTWPWNDLISVVGDAERIGLWTERPEPLLRSSRLGVEVVAGDDERLGEIDALGGIVRFGGVAGLTDLVVPDGPFDDYRWHGIRSSGSFQAPLGGRGRLRAHRLELGWQLVAVDRDLHPTEELRAGGDHPYALRIGAVEPSLPFPGYAPWALSGEAVAIASVGWRFPIARSLQRRWGPVSLEHVYGRIAGDAGNVWTVEGLAPAPILGDVVGEVRTSMVLHDVDWDSFVRLAWPIVPLPDDRRAVDPVLPWLDGPSRPRLYVGIGTGF